MWILLLLLLLYQAGRSFLLLLLHLGYSQRYQFGLFQGVNHKRAVLFERFYLDRTVVILP